MILCEGSAIYIFLIALKIVRHSFLSKSLPHNKIQLHLPSKSSSANFQSFCPPRSIVKEVRFFISRNDMKFIQFLHMPKLSPSSKLQLSQSIYVSLGSIYTLWSDWHVAKQGLSRPLPLP